MLIAVEHEAQIIQVAELARAIWRQHFTPIIGAEQVAYMLASLQSQAAIAEQIRHQGMHYYLLAEEGVAFGYLAYGLEPTTLFLSKLYIRADFRRQGHGQRALDWLEEQARNHQRGKITLTVNRHNGDTINAYHAMGFVIAGSQIKAIGAGFVMDDYVMEKRLSTP